MRIINKQYHIVSHENAFLPKKKKGLVSALIGFSQILLIHLSPLKATEFPVGCSCHTLTLTAATLTAGQPGTEVFM